MRRLHIDDFMSTSMINFFQVNMDFVNDIVLNIVLPDKSNAIRCRFGDRFLCYINYCYIIFELRIKLKMIAYLRKVDTLKMDNEIIWITLK